MGERCEKVFIETEDRKFMRKRNPAFTRTAKKAILRAIYDLTKSDATKEEHFGPTSINRSAKFDSPVSRYVDGAYSYDHPFLRDIRPIVQDYVLMGLVQERRTNRSSWTRYRANMSRASEIESIIS